jgi:hypothetical protein
VRREYPLSGIHRACEVVVVVVVAAVRVGEGVIPTQYFSAT